MKNKLKLAYLSAFCLMLSSPVFAQVAATGGAFGKGTAMLESVRAWLMVIAGTVVTMALMLVGFRMVFNAAQWKDVAPVFWGGIVIGSAAAIAAMLVNPA